VGKSPKPENPTYESQKKPTLGRPEGKSAMWDDKSVAKESKKGERTDCCSSANTNSLRRTVIQGGGYGRITPVNGAEKGKKSGRKKGREGKEKR